VQACGYNRSTKSLNVADRFAGHFVGLHAGGNVNR